MPLVPPTGTEPENPPSPLPQSMVMALVMVRVPNSPGSRQSISPPAAVFTIAPAKVLQGVLRSQALASSPLFETHVCGGKAGCVNVNVWPAMVSVPDRSGPGLAVTEYNTTPLPVPDAPAVIDIKFAFDAAVHTHPFSAITFTMPRPPAACVVAPLAEMP